MKLESGIQGVRREANTEMLYQISNGNTTPLGSINDVDQVLNLIILVTKLASIETLVAVIPVFTQHRKSDNT